MSPLSRRTVLRGAGACVALPLLEAMIPARARAADLTPPRRFLAFVWPNGRHGPAWTPTTTGTGYDLPPSLTPLAPLQHRVSVLSGLFGYDRTGDHALAGRSVLSAVRDLDQLSYAQSIDVEVSAVVGGSTAIPLLALSSEPPVRCRTDDCAQQSHCSWRHDGTPVARDTDPRAAFERLFGAPDPGAAPPALRRAGGRSILDAVSADAAELSARLGAEDRHRIAAWLEAVRALEQRLDTPADPSCPSGVTPLHGGALGQEAHVEAMLDVAVAALACDRTRVVSYMLGVESSERSLRFLGHDLGHHGASHEDPAAYTDITRWIVARYVGLMARLDAVPVASGGTLLDHTLVLGVSGMSDGTAHDGRDLPVLLAGAGAPEGRHRRFEATSVTRLYTSVLRAFGSGDRFGSLGLVPLLDLT